MKKNMLDELELAINPLFDKYYTKQLILIMRDKKNRRDALSVHIPSDISDVEGIRRDISLLKEQIEYLEKVLEESYYINIS